MTWAFRYCRMLEQGKCASGSSNIPCCTANAIGLVAITPSILALPWKGAACAVCAPTRDRNFMTKKPGATPGQLQVVCQILRLLGAEGNRRHVLTGKCKRHGELAVKPGSQIALKPRIRRVDAQRRFYRKIGRA